jgi:hypothetical protein
MSIEVELKRIADALENIVGKNTVPAAQIDPVKKPKKEKPEVEQTAPAPVTESVYTSDQLMVVLRKHAEKFGAEKSKMLMKKYGATSPKIVEIPVKNYPALIAEVTAQLEADPGIV